MIDILLAGGRIVTGSATYDADVAIQGSRIVGLLDRSVRPQAKEVIDVSGKLVMPGVIDPHVHYRTRHSFNADTLDTVTASAAYGGMTSLFLFVGPIKGQSTERNTYATVDTSGVDAAEFFEAVLKESENSAVIDYGFHCQVFPDPGVVKQIPRIMEFGISSFKLVMGYRRSRGMIMDDRLLANAMDLIQSHGCLAMVHAENGDIIEFLEDRFMAENRYGPDTFLASRPNLAEAEAVYRALTIAQTTGCPLYVVHVSAAEALRLVIEAKAQGQQVIAETCPQYLLLTEQDTREQGGLVKIAPPLRTAEDNAALWRGLRQGFITTIGSDHAAFDRERQKQAAATFAEVPYGLPGVETMMSLVHSEGVAKGRITLNQMVQALSENPARTFGIYPRKGSLAAGADADIVVFDPNLVWEVRGKDLHSRANYTPFEGWKLTGKPVLSLLRGKVLLKDDKLHQGTGSGQYLRRPLT